MIKKDFISKIIKIVGTALMLSMVVSTTAFAAAPNYQSDLQKLVEFINFIIGIIKWGSAIVAGLIGSIIGWKMIVTIQGDAMTVAKKGAKNLFWGLIVVFCASYVVQFFVGKLASLF